MVENRALKGKIRVSNELVIEPGLCRFYDRARLAQNCTFVPRAHFKELDRGVRSRVNIKVLPVESHAHR